VSLLGLGKCTGGEFDEPGGIHSLHSGEERSLIEDRPVGPGGLGRYGIVPPWATGIAEGLGIDGPDENLVGEVRNRVVIGPQRPGQISPQFGVDNEFARGLGTSKDQVGNMHQDLSCSGDPGPVSGHRASPLVNVDEAISMRFITLGDAEGLRSLANS
jgi:hypothetical protein